MCIYTSRRRMTGGYYYISPGFTIRCVHIMPGFIKCISVTCLNSRAPARSVSVIHLVSVQYSPTVGMLFV